MGLIQTFSLNEVINLLSVFLCTLMEFLIQNVFQFCLDLCLQIGEVVQFLNQMTLWLLACFHTAVLCSQKYVVGKLFWK